MDLSWRLNSRGCCSNVLINTSRKYLLFRSWLNRLIFALNPPNFFSFYSKQNAFSWQTGLCLPNHIIIKNHKSAIYILLDSKIANLTDYTLLLNNYLLINFWLHVHSPLFKYKHANVLNFLTTDNCHKLNWICLKTVSLTCRLVF